MKEIREGGGVYVYRTRKPASLLGRMPIRVWHLVLGAAVACLSLWASGGPWFFGLALLLCSGRHFAYVGETVSFRDRHGEHTRGGGRWARKAQPWADLDPRCVFRLPMPKWKWLLRSTETMLIFLLAPVYNHKKNLWNPRRITLNSARRQRRRRDKRENRWNFNLRPAHLVVIAALLITAHVQGVF